MTASGDGADAVGQDQAEVTALVVVPDPVLAGLLAARLAAQGCRIDMAGDTELAWAQFQGERPAILVTEISLVRGGDQTFCERVRGHPSGQDIVLVGVIERRLRGEVPGWLDLLDECIERPSRPWLLDWRLRRVIRLAGERRRLQSRAASPQAAAENALVGRTVDTPPPEIAPSQHEPASTRVGRLFRALPRSVSGLLGRGRRVDDGPGPGQSIAAEAARSPESAGDTAVVPPPTEPVEEARGRVSPGVSDGLWDWDLEHHQVSFSDQWKALVGYQPDELTPGEEEWFSRVHPAEAEAVRIAIADHLEDRTSHLEVEHRIKTKDGSYRRVLCRGLAFRDGLGRAVRMVGSLTDVSLSTGTDTVTGLPNRGSFIARLTRALEPARDASPGAVAVLYLGLDRFKNINYSLGHGVGDLLLGAVAGRLQGALKNASEPGIAGGVVGHVSGDEFAVLLESIADPALATQTARLIQEALQPPFTIAAHEIFVTASIGIAVTAPELQRPEDLLREADTAMNRAKAVGKSSYLVFEDTMHTGAVELLRLETELRRAVQRQEFRVVYQPIVHLGSGRITGFEALVRWQHPTGRLVAPDEFIPVAEETGLIVSIDRFVLHEVCRQLRTWENQFRRKPPLTVAVNVSGVEFMKPDTMVEIDRALRTHGVYGRSLKIEITESVIMEHSRYAADMLAHLRALDVRLSIDDFGTGYSSLSYLRRFEIDTLKIDRSFVSRMDTDDECAEIVRAIAQLATNLGKEVVAEGVERRVQVDELLTMGCTYGQGYFFSRPVDPKTAATLLAEEANGTRLMRS